MKWLVTGVGPHNKGAELMLLAMLAQVRSADPDAVVAINPTVGDYTWRALRGLHQVFDPERLGRLGALRKRLFHAAYRERFGLVLPEEVEVVLDASGYAFGDTWKPEHVEHAAALFERYRRLGARVVLLPQAFGPFETPRIREASRRILAAAGLVFARDAESLEYCRALVPDHAALYQAPDFTNLLGGHLPAGWVSDARHVAVVPNRQMVAQGAARDYVQIMARALRLVADAGFQPLVLVHERRDPEVATEIARAAGFPAAVVHQADPLVLKGILGACALTVGSRFHGLISALSQGVPSVGTSWSHKYHYLFADYDAADFLSQLDDGGGTLLERVQRLIDDPTRAAVAQRLHARARSIKEEARAMWRRTFEHVVQAA